MLNYNHLYYFHVAAAEGSLSAAAARLGVKQSTISEQLRTLERTLHRALLERTSTGMRLTPAGRVVHEHTTVMFRAGDRMLHALGEAADPVPRSLRVGISGPVARATSADFLLPLFALDDCMPVITTGEMLDLLRHLRANDLDLVLCENEAPDATVRHLERVLIARTPLVAIAPIDLDPGPDWRDIGLVQYRAGTSFRLEVEAYLEQRGFKPRIVGEADDPLLLVEAAVRGRYVVVVPRPVARDALVAGRVRTLAQIEPVHAGVHALYQTGGPELARRAIEMLITAARAA